MEEDWCSYIEDSELSLLSIVLVLATENLKENLQYSESKDTRWAISCKIRKQDISTKKGYPPSLFLLFFLAVFLFRDSWKVLMW